MDLAALLSKVPPKNKYRAKHGGPPSSSSSSSTSTALSLKSYDGKGLGQSLTSNGTLVVKKGDDGLLDTTLLSRIGRNVGDVVYSDRSALVERNVGRNELARPSEEEADAVAAKTAAALGTIVDSKILNAKPLTVYSKGDEASHSKFVSYKPAQIGAVEQRVIRLVQEQRDPMDPPRCVKKFVFVIFFIFFFHFFPFLFIFSSFAACPFLCYFFCILFFSHFFLYRSLFFFSFSFPSISFPSPSISFPSSFSFFLIFPPDIHIERIQEGAQKHLYQFFIHHLKS